MQKTMPPDFDENDKIFVTEDNDGLLLLTDAIITNLVSY